MYLGLAAALLVASRLTHLSTVFMGTRVGSGLLLAGGLVVLMGIVDDRWGLGAITKMAGQVGAGAILVWSGAVVAWLPVPGGGTLSLTSDQQTVLTILVVVVTINAVNFIDGLDGLAAGIVGIGAAAFFLYYYTLTKRLGLDEQTNPALASAILAGVCLGFLPHNFHPARIFMGNTGSMLLGLLLAYAPHFQPRVPGPEHAHQPVGLQRRDSQPVPGNPAAAGAGHHHADPVRGPAARGGAADRAGQSPFSADKHLQHRLLAIGHSHRGSVLLMYLWAALFAGTVVLLSIMRTKLFVLGFVTLAGVLVLLLASMPRLRPWKRGQLRLAPDVAGPVPAAVAGPSGGRRSAAGAAPRCGDGGGSRAARHLHDLPGPGTGRGHRGAGPGRAGRAGLGLAGPGRPRGWSGRGATVRRRGAGTRGMRPACRGDMGYRHPRLGDAGSGDQSRDGAGHGDSRPGTRARRLGWDARPAARLGGSPRGRRDW